MSKIIVSLFSFICLLLLCKCHSTQTSIANKKNYVDTSLIPKDSNAFYFPVNQRRKTFINDKLDSFTNNWISIQLFALKEPVIFSDSSTKEIYRFTWLRTFHNPVAIRIEKHDSLYILFWKLSNGAGGYGPGKLIIDRQKIISEENWKAFKHLISKTDFWNLPTLDSKIGFDGSEWIMEGKSENIYHVVKRWSPKKNPYTNCCKYLLDLTDLNISKKEEY